MSRNCFLFLLVVSVFFVSCGVKKPAKKEIVSVTWMDKSFKNEIKYTGEGDIIGVLVKTKNYRKGEIISIKIGVDDDSVENADTTLINIRGTVDAKGVVRAIVDLNNL